MNARDAALAYAARGWAVFPTAGKVPLTEHGFKDASSDRGAIEDWYADHPDAGVGIATGESGLVVVDVDTQHGGEGTLRELEREFGPLPKTYEVLTGGGGRHLYYKAPAERPVRNSAGKLGTAVDIRATGGYVVAAPTVHDSGRCYKVLHDRELAELPEAWLDRMTETRRTAPGNGTGNGDGHGPILSGKRNATLTSLAGTMRRRGMTAKEIEAALGAVNQARCRPPLDRDEVSAIAFSVERYRPVPELSDPMARTDIGNAELFTKMHGQRFRYVSERNAWYFWRDGRWRRDASEAAWRAGKQVVRELARQATYINPDEAQDGAARKERKAIFAHALNSQADHRVRALLHLARSEPEIALLAEDFDRDPLLLSCGNGTVDLRTGELREHDPNDLISLGTNVPLDAGVAVERWERFLAEIFLGREDLIAWVRLAIGYTLCGDTSEQCLLVTHGTGGNGKSVFLTVLRWLLGDLATVAGFDTFTRTRWERIRNDIARLYRARLVVASEGKEGARLDEAVVKPLTGGDAIAARFLHQEYFEFVPEFKLWLATNHLPRIDASDDAIWERVRLIPFEARFRGTREQNRGLLPELKAELPGILAWAVQACLDWQREGLGEIELVQHATDEYREAEDFLGAFLTERCEFGDEFKVSAKELREGFDAYCKEIGERPLSAVALGRELAKRGILKDGSQRKYVGLQKCRDEQAF